MAEGGYDTASFIYDVRAAAVTKYGVPNYWIRYFSPAPNRTTNESSTIANAEVRAAWDSGGKRLSPVTSPSQTRLSGTTAQGQADAQTFVSALLNVYGWVGPLLTPSNNVLRCWLDQEASTAMSTAYWTGWSSYINGYNWRGNGTYPLYACLYCNPCGGVGKNCTTVGSAGHCWAIWSSQPQTGYCSYSLKSKPPWSAKACAGCSSAAPSTQLWQFASPSACGLTVNVDINEGTLAAYAFLIAYRP